MLFKIDSSNSLPRRISQQGTLVLGSSSIQNFDRPPLDLIIIIYDAREEAVGLCGIDAVRKGLIMSGKHPEAGAG